MHGKIISYDDETEIGIILGDDGKNYTLSLIDCRSVIKPKENRTVNFDPHSDKATEVYVIAENIQHESHHHLAPQSTHHQAKKPTSTYLPVVVIGSLVIFLGILIYGELDRKRMAEVQNHYESQIKKIEAYLAAAECTKAQSEYTHAQETRTEISKMGLYYSLDSHAKQAHSIEIAECYANRHEFKEATNMLDIHGIHEPDYLLRASVIYKNSGDTMMAEKAKSIADTYDTSDYQTTNKKR